MRWRKIGRVFEPNGEFPWMCSHAAVPCAELLADGTVAVYFTSRDADRRGYTARGILEIGDAPRLVHIDPEPVLAPGALGCFDDSGAMASWLTTVGNDRYLYYIGWNRGVTVPFRNATGLAISKSGGPFVRVSEGPVLDRSLREPQFATNPCVLFHEGVWRMWYLSCVAWEPVGTGVRHRYHLKYCECADGIDWRPTGCVAIDFQDPSEYAISRPCVVKDGAEWRMWYSYRGDKYRIGYAVSDDGITWTRRDRDAGLSVSAAGWDSESVEYSHVFDHSGRRFMLYNGNDFGRTGFGIAVLD